MSYKKNQWERRKDFLGEAHDKAKITWWSKPVAQLSDTMLWLVFSQYDFYPLYKFWNSYNALSLKPSISLSLKPILNSQYKWIFPHFCPQCFPSFGSLNSVMETLSQIVVTHEWVPMVCELLIAKRSHYFPHDLDLSLLLSGVSALLN